MPSSDTAVALGFLLTRLPAAGRTAAVQAMLTGPEGRHLRRKLARWIADLLSVEQTVPEIYNIWRPVVHDAMMFVVSQLSAVRLAPKIVEQFELPLDTPVELRLLRLIERVPGLQKIGQLLARNHRLSGRLRRALSQLENGISDVGAGEIGAEIARQLGPRLQEYRVRITPAIYFEASVSAVVRFTWVNPATGRRELGVFKVLKPHIPLCYAEDMRILESLAGHLARRHYGKIGLGGLSETLTEVRLLLEREVDFRREQATLLRVGPIYESLPGIRVPHVIEPLCTDGITALTHEAGVKITSAFVRTTGREVRVRVAERLAETLLAFPALAPDARAIYHADPHAGNLLYDRLRDDIVILDWALTEQLTRHQRKNVVLMILHLLLRDPDGLAAAIRNLCESSSRDRSLNRLIRQRVDDALARLPLFPVPGAMSAMRLLESVALAGVGFPAALLMFRKASFTLEGVLADVAAEEVRIDTVVMRYALRHTVRSLLTFAALLSPLDLLALQWGLLTYASRVTLQLVRRPWLGLPDFLVPAALRG